MTRQQLLCILLLIEFVAFAASSPAVYWSMNELNNGILQPDIPAVDNGTYSVNLKETKNIGTAPGFYGNGLETFGKLVSFSNVRKEDLCLMQPWNCVDTGFSVAGWFVIRSFGLLDCLMSTSVLCDPGLAGVFLRPRNNRLEAGVRLTTGELYTASASLLQQDEWTHVGMTWKGSEGLKIYINGSEANYIEQPAVTIEATKQALPVLQLGFISSSFTLIVDDLKTWNHLLSSDEMFRALPEGPEPVATTTTTIQPSTTTSSTTSAQTTTTTTTIPKTRSTTSSEPVKTSTEPAKTSSEPAKTSSQPTKTSSQPATTSDALEVTTNTIGPSQPKSDSWKWIIIAFCIILFLFICSLLLLLLRNQRRRKEFQPVAMHDVRTATTAATSSVAVSDLP